MKVIRLDCCKAGGKSNRKGIACLIPSCKRLPCCEDGLGPLQHPRSITEPFLVFAAQHAGALTGLITMHCESGTTQDSLACKMPHQIAGHAWYLGGL